MITLFQFYRVWGLPNASPFCMKVETYLRMTRLPYDIKFINNPQQGPKGKLPYIQLDGKSYADSELIIDELKTRFDDQLDNDLSEEQKALAVLIENTFSERLYWIAVYLRWQDDAGWKHVKRTMFGKLPAFPRLFVPGLVRRNMLKALYSQGMGRHSLEEVVRLGCKTIDAMAVLLGDKPFFLGDKVSSVDATAFSFLANMIFSPLNDPFKQHVLQFENIKTYCARMWDDYFPDLVKPELL